MHVCATASARETIGGPSDESRTACSRASFHCRTTFAARGVVVCVFLARRCVGAVRSTRATPPAPAAWRSRRRESLRVVVSAVPFEPSGLRPRRGRVGPDDHRVGHLDDLVDGQIRCARMAPDRLGARCLVDAHRSDRAVELLEDVAADPGDVVGHPLALCRSSAPPLRRDPRPSASRRAAGSRRSPSGLLLVVIDALDGRATGGCPNRRNYLGFAPALPVLEQREAAGDGDRLAARVRVELAEDCRDVVVDGAGREKQPLGDLCIAKPVGEETKDVELSGREPGDVRAGRAPRASRDVATASRRRRCATTDAAAAAPRESSAASDARRASSLATSARASAASYGRPSSDQQAAAGRRHLRPRVRTGRRRKCPSAARRCPPVVAMPGARR